MIVGIILVLFPNVPTDRLRNIAFDTWQRLAPRVWSPEFPVRIIAIDDTSISIEGQWPWPRDRIAELLEKISKLEPAAVGFDIIFSEEDRLSLPEILKRLPPSDERDMIASKLKDESIRKSNYVTATFQDSPVSLAAVLTNDGSNDLPKAKSTPVILGTQAEKALPRFKSAMAPIDSLRESAPGLGAINVLPDSDLIIRTVPTAFVVGNEPQTTILPSLFIELLRLAQRDLPSGDMSGPSALVRLSNASGEMQIGAAPTVTSLKIGAFQFPTERDGQLRIHYTGHQEGRFISASDIFSGRTSPDEIRDRILLVGITAAGLGDIHSTPIDPVLHGVEIHAEAIEQVVSEAKLVRPDYSLGTEIALIFIFGIILSILARKLRPAFSGVAVISVMIVIFTGSFLAFTKLQWMLDAIVPSFTLGITWASVTVSAYRKSEAERKFIRTAFSRYLAPEVVKKIADHPENLRLGGEARNVTVLFSDIRNFTTRSEKMSAENVVQFLNHVMTPLTAEVLKSDGAVDKYLGDGLMAYWNAPLDIDDHVNRACGAALNMIDELKQLNTRYSGTMQDVAIGIGLNYGSAFAGNMGSEQRFDYSLVGDTVNVASRLESTTKLLGVDIIVSESVADHASLFLFVPLGTVSLKGRHENMPVYHLYDCKKNKPDEFDDFLVAHGKVIDAASNIVELKEAILIANSYKTSDRYKDFYNYLLNL